MAEENILSAGAITQILEGGKPVNPVMQIIGYKPMTPDQMAYGQTTDELRYRLMIGDGLRTYQYCVITNQDLVTDIKDGRLEKWSVIKVTSYQTVDCGDGPPENKRRLVYILNLDVIRKGSAVGHKITVSADSVNLQQQQQQEQQNHLQQQQHNQQHQQQNYQQQYQQQQPQQPTQAQPYPRLGGGINPDVIRSPRSMRASHDQQTIQIQELTPYIGKWIIKGRVVSKSGIREYNNAKGPGKLFNFVLADKSGEIKVTAFNADCERVFPYVEPNKVYILGKASIKPADPRYSKASFECTLNNDSLIEEVIDKSEINEMPLAKFNFQSIAGLSGAQANQIVDLIGAVQEVSDVSTIVSRTQNKELKKRNIVIVDMSRHSIGITLWGEQAESFSAIEGDVFVAKEAKLGTWNGLSATARDCIFVNPDIPETRKIKSWFSNLLDRNFTSLTAQDSQVNGGDQWKTLEQLLNKENARNVASSGQPSSAYGKCKAILLSVGKNPVYKCCPTDGCGKKLQDTQNGELRCEKCQQTYSDYRFRYKTDVEIADQSSSTWVTLWDDKAEQILKMKPEELERYMKMDNKESYERVITRPNFTPYIFTLRARLDTYNQEERVKLNVISMSVLDQTILSKRLITEIKGMTAA